MYQIANINISIKEIYIDLRTWGKFTVNGQEKADISISKLQPFDIRYNIESILFSKEATKIYRSGADVLLSNEEGSKFWTLPVAEPENIDSFLVLAFYTHAVRRQMLQLHCATIDDGGRGILFLGPSGIGKTTQAERWAQYRGSAIINGDIGFVQRTPAGYTAWGTPWHGSSPYCLNASVPVKALVVLKQAPQNALRELTGFEKVREVSGSVFYPTWLEDGMELCTDTLNHLLSDLPVYRLDNRADEEAVRLLAAEIDRIS